MKDKRIWLVIICILMIGIAVTSYTRTVIREQETAEGFPDMAAFAAAESGAEENLKGFPDTRLKDTEEKQGDSAANDRSVGTPATGSELRAIERPRPASAAASEGVPAETAADGESSGEPVSDSEVQAYGVAAAQVPAADSDPAAQPALGAAGLSAALASESETAGAEGKDASGEKEESEAGIYRKRLNDLDAQIQKMREEEKDPNVYSIKTSAETEVKMWDSEMNTVYNALLAILPQEEAEALAKEQKEWLKTRESSAAEQSGKTGNVGGITYSSSLVNLIRDRAYELADRYEEVKSGTQGSSGR